MAGLQREITISLYKEDMPQNVSGALCRNGPDNFIIMVNDNLSETMQAASFLHEVLHIYNRDPEKQATAGRIEYDMKAQLAGIADIWKSNL